VIKIIFAILISICLVDIKYIYAKAVLSDEAVSYRENGYEAQQNGNIDAAISWYQKSAGIDPSYATPHNDLGILFETKGWLDRAETEYKKALAIDSNYEKAHTNIALLYEKKQEKEKAAFHWMKRYKIGAPGDLWTDEALARLKKLDLLGNATENQLREDKKRQKEQDPKKNIQRETNVPKSTDLHKFEDRISSIEREVLEDSVKIEGVNERLQNLDVEKKLIELDNKLRRIEKDVSNKNKLIDVENSFDMAEDMLESENIRKEMTLKEDTVEVFTSEDVSSEALVEAFYLAEDQIRRERLEKK